MAQILFDKILTVRKLEGEGQFTRRQAETLSKVMHDAMSAGVATKSGLSLTESALRADSEALKAEIGAVRHDLRVVETTLRSELKAEVAGLRGGVKADIAQATVQTIVWVGGIMVTLLVASGLMQHFLR
jgi:flagellar motility protein MotE (MotC chaperone)